MGSGTGTTGLSWLFGDHLGSTSITVDVTDNNPHLLSQIIVTKTGELRYKGWGETRYTDGTTNTTYRYTGQRQDSYINLYWYSSRWYDDALGRFIQPDSIIPGVGEGDNPNAVGYLGISTYSPLVVDYHENQFLDQSNSENRIRLQDPSFRLPPVPTNSIAFDRYAYSLNNPVRYSDPTGHCPFCLVLAAITPIGWVAIGVSTAAVVVYFAVPGVRETVTNGMNQVGEAAANGIQTLFARGEYVPPGLSALERQAYRDAVHRYKDIWGLGAADDVDKEILDAIAEKLKEGAKPIDAAESVDGPPEDE